MFGVSGIVLWWPKAKRWRQAFIIKRGSHSFRFYRDLHSVFGIWGWDLINGLLFGFDFGLAKEINRRRDIYIYADSRGLIDNRNIPTQRDILFYQAITRSYGTDKGYGSINIYAGISF